MKPLSISIVAIATFFFTVCTSFTNGNARAELPKTTSKQPYYFWYLTSGDSYQGYWPTSTEIEELEEAYDVYVDTDPSGTLLASGYFIEGVPHPVWPSVNLYGHF